MGANVDTPDIYTSERRRMQDTPNTLLGVVELPSLHKQSRMDQLTVVRECQAEAS
jgi:hypothetical protein